MSIVSPLYTTPPTNTLLSVTVMTAYRVDWLFRYESTEDYLFKVAPIVFWSNLELTLGIIVGSIQTWRPLLRPAEAGRPLAMVLP